MNDPEPGPPKWAESVLRSLSRPSDRESIPGDLLEEYRAVKRPACGATRADAWYVRQVFSTLWPLTWPYALATIAAAPIALPVKGWWNYSLVPAPAISALYCAIYFAAGYFASRRTQLIRTGTLAAAATSFLAFTFAFTWFAIRDPGLLLAPFSNPFIFVILSALLLIALGHAVVVGTLAGAVGRWHSTRQSPVMQTSW
jgi:hypothetical protein